MRAHGFVILALLAGCGDNLKGEQLTGDPCDTASDCPGTEGACLTKVCTMGVCTPSITSSGTVIADQTDGDCHQSVCDGLGNVIANVDDSDAPASDANDCTTEVCTNGEVVKSNVAESMTCGTGAGMICNGQGACVGCVNWTQCPGNDTDCKQRTCSQAGVCGVDFQPDLTPRTSQVAKDCKKKVCDGAGGSKTINDDADLPNDGNICTTDTCSNGSVVEAPANNPGTVCTVNTVTGVCDANGGCVQCITSATCPGVDDECQMRTCSVAGQCGVINTSGSTSIAQTAGNCHMEACDGNGGHANPIDQNDPPVDANACTDNTCSAAGVGSNPDSPTTTACGVGLHCDGAGACVPVAIGPWAPSDGWDGDAPCFDGVKFGMPDPTAMPAAIPSFGFACSKTKGVYRGTTTAGTVTWATSNTGITDLNGRVLAVHTVAVNQAEYISAGTLLANGFRSTMNGTSWSGTVTNTAIPATRQFDSFRFQPQVSNVFGAWDLTANKSQVLIGMNPPYAANDITTAQGPVVGITGYSPTGAPAPTMLAAVDGSTTNAGGVFVSTNKGLGWTADSTGLAAADLQKIAYITLDPTTGAGASLPVLYLAIKGGGQIYKATDATNTWVQSNVGLPPGASVNVIHVAPHAPLIVYAATTNGLYKSVDGGANWALAGFQARNVIGVATAPDDETNVIVATDAGLFKPM